MNYRVRGFVLKFTWKPIDTTSILMVHYSNTIAKFTVIYCKYCNVVMTTTGNVCLENKITKEVARQTFEGASSFSRNL